MPAENKGGAYPLLMEVTMSIAKTIVAHGSESAEVIKILDPILTWKVNLIHSFLIFYCCFKFKLC